jgi:hypothetical protein
MKNMSFGKMVGIFAGFLVLMVIVAVVIIKMNQKSGNSAPQVVTKTHAKREQPVEAKNTAQPTVPTVAEQAMQPATAVTVITAPAVAVPADLVQRLSNTDITLSNLEARIAALESLRSTPTAAGVQKAPRRRAAMVVSAAPTSEIQEKLPTTLTGYKSLAVVNNRAWVAAPDGFEGSAIKGDALPNVRIRSMSVESGVVVTTNDNRIEPH